MPNGVWYKGEGRNQGGGLRQRFQASVENKISASTNMLVQYIQIQGILCISLRYNDMNILVPSAA